ncbi:MAG TPA: hypothetical protein G4O04_06040 [Anaerolineae bacterium]|nr:hypothetical protein [Anaerolineae bacterium]
MAKKRRSTPRRSARRGGRVEFNPDYSYVKSDLRRIATLAGSFIFLMVVLSFFFR